jgi:hypothetical protein
LYERGAASCTVDGWICVVVGCKVFYYLSEIFADCVGLDYLAEEGVSHREVTDVTGHDVVARALRKICQEEVRP